MKVDYAAKRVLAPFIFCGRRATARRETVRVTSLCLSALTTSEIVVGALAVPSFTHAFICPLPTDAHFSPCMS